MSLPPLRSLVNFTLSDGAKLIVPYNLEFK